MRRLLLPLIMIPHLTGCETNRFHPDDIPPEFDHGKLSYESLTGRVVVPASFVGYPAGMLALGEHLVISDYPTGEGALHLVDLTTGERLLSFGRVGEGPGEFTSIPRLLRDPVDPQSFWAFDPGASRLSRFHIRDLLGRLIEPTRMVPLTFPRIMYDVQFVGPGALAGLGLAPDGRLALIDVDSGTVTFHGSIPDALEGLPRSVVQHAYQSQLALSPDRERIVLAHWRGGGFEIYDAGGNPRGGFNGPFAFEPDFMVDEGPRGPIMRAGPRNRYGYLDLVTTDSLIIALFSGRAEAHYRRDAWIGEYLHVFSWAGQLLRAFRLDRPVHNITLSPDGAGILAACEVDPELGEPAIIRYALDLRGIVNRHGEEVASVP